MKTPKNTSVNSTKYTDLIIEAGTKGFRKVEVKFKKIESSDFPFCVEKYPKFLALVGSQKIETFDVITEGFYILSIMRGGEFEQIKFTN